MSYYFIQITDGFAVAAIVFIWIMILWNIKMKTTVEKLKYQNAELKEKLGNLHIVCEFQEDLIKQQESN